MDANNEERKAVFLKKAERAGKLWDKMTPSERQQACEDAGSTDAVRHFVHMTWAELWTACMIPATFMQSPQFKESEANGTILA